MKNITLLLLIFATFSCAPTMESDVDKVCEITTEIMDMASEAMTLSVKALSGDADSMKEAADQLKDLEVKTDKMEEEMNAIKERNKDKEEEFTELLMKNCEIAKSMMQMID